MAHSSPGSEPASPAIEAVLFDFHSTLVDQGVGRDWLQLAWEQEGRTGDHTAGLGPDTASALASRLEAVWEFAREIDPDSTRDLDPAVHRSVFDKLVPALPGVDEALVAALYDTITDPWVAYDDAAPLLRALRTRGVRTALVSNVAVDVRPVLARSGLAGLLDAVVLSFEAGVAKPDPRIFQIALDALEVAPGRALMVGDSWRDDGGAAGLGIRTLVLPRTSGSVHGLDLVLRLVDVAG